MGKEAPATRTLQVIAPLTLSRGLSQPGSGRHLPHSPAPEPQPIVLLAPIHPLYPSGQAGWTPAMAPCQPSLYRATLAGLAWACPEHIPDLFAELPVPGNPHQARERHPGAWKLQTSERSCYSLTVLEPESPPASLPCALSSSPGCIEPIWCLSPDSQDVPPPATDTCGTVETQVCLHSHQSYSETGQAREPV